MSKTIWYFFVLFIIIILVYLFRDRIDTFSAGTLTQLYAKGPQDLYLTGGDTYKYIPPYFTGFEWIWNNPTRLSSAYYPLYGIYPYYFRYIPYYWQI